MTETEHSDSNAMVAALRDWEQHYPVDALAWSEREPEIASNAVSRALLATLDDLREDGAAENHPLLARLGEDYFGWVMSLGISARRPGHDALLELLRLDGRVLSRVLRPALVQELSWVLRRTVAGDPNDLLTMVTDTSLAPGTRGVVAHALVGCVYDEAIDADTVANALESMLLRVGDMPGSGFSLGDVMGFNAQLIELLSILPSTDAHQAHTRTLLEDLDLVLDNPKRTAELRGLAAREAETRALRSEREQAYWTKHRDRVDFAPSTLLERRRPPWIEPSAPGPEHREAPRGSTRTADVLFRHSDEGRAVVPNDAWMARLLLLAWDRFSWTLADLDAARMRKVLLAAPPALPASVITRLDSLIAGVKAFWVYMDRAWELPHAAEIARYVDDPALRLDLDDAFARHNLSLQSDSRTAAKRSESKNQRRRRRKRR